MKNEPMKLPELLCPAGTEKALEAAIQGGADAVYLGGTVMNARMHAGNFEPEALSEAVKLAHTYGVKVYLTLNTAVFDRELNGMVNAAWDAACRGVDALIVADAGGACAIHRSIPSLELHASTQMSGHNSLMGYQLKDMGFSRMVLAREISAADLMPTVRNSPIETELFVHGALCVCHSGQCLFSSMVGGRSGNRGECAQPCRLPYTDRKGKRSYPLSLKDLSLAMHLEEIIASGVSSLKIEGRMKSPEYVLQTAAVWRKLLDERRNATWEEMQTLAEIFSRSGLTDGYFTGKINSGMLGIRREEDKKNSREAQPFQGLQRKLPLTVTVKIRKDVPMVFSVTDGTKSVTVTGEIPQIAKTAPLGESQVQKSIGTLGDTCYFPEKIKIELDEGLMVPVSCIKSMRRNAMEKWIGENAVQIPTPEKLPFNPRRPENSEVCRTARFQTKEQIPDSARVYFKRIYLPLFGYDPIADGVVMPPVIFENEIPAVKAELRKAAEAGAKYALVGNLGHLELAKEAGLTVYGDYRLNVTNRETLALAETAGMQNTILSPELSLAGLRDFAGCGEVIVYGRIPLMTVEKCVIKEVAGCEICKQGKAVLTDRMNISFPVLREWEHRNVIYNSLPTGMSEKEEELQRSNILCRHFLFSAESRKESEEVIRAYQRGDALPFPVRRISKT